MSPIPYTVPHTIAPGETVTVATMNNEWGGNASYLANPPFCSLTHSTTQSITASGAWQALTFDTEDGDTANLHSTVTDPTRITVTDAGIYVVGAGVNFSANATGVRAIGLRVSGTGSTAPGKGRVIALPISGSDVDLAIARPLKLTAGQWVEAVVLQSSGGALNSQAVNGNPFLSVVWAGLG